MNFFVVRLKRHPHLFVGKKNPSYAFNSDQHIQDCLKGRWSSRLSKDADDVLQPTAHWFVTEKRAKVWTNPSQLKALFTYRMERDDDGKPFGTFNEYEIVMNNTVILTFEELKAMKG
jgi:hypothetical protein